MTARAVANAPGWANPLAPEPAVRDRERAEGTEEPGAFDVSVTDHAEFGLDMPCYGNNFAIMREPDGNEICLQATSEAHDE